MRVMLYGESERFGSGAWCYAEALRDLGHELVAFSDGERLEPARRLWARAYAKVARRPWEPYRHSHTGALRRLAAAERPEAVIILKGLFLSREDVFDLRRTGAWVVNINHDDFFSRNRNNWSPVQRRAVPAYDFIFPTREVNVAEIRPLNPNVEFFPFAYHPKLHRPVEVPAVDRERFAADVVFVGTWEAPRARLLEALVLSVRARYAVYGEQWGNLPPGSPLKPFIRPPVWGDDLCRVVGSSKIALAFLRKENRDDYTQRTFEIPACGGVLLAERTHRHLQYYREGAEAEFFDASNADELASKVHKLLADSDFRESLRANGMLALKRQQHTYTDRLSRLVQVFHSTRKITRYA